MKEIKYEGQYLRTFAKVDLSIIADHLRKTKCLIGEKTKLMAIIKADGYGHGAVPVAQEIDQIVDAYGVAVLEEAIELRTAGITKLILILGTSANEEAEQLVFYDIAATVFQYSFAKALSIEAKRQNKTAVIHIKIDTGMGRIGYPTNQESINEIVKISKLPNLKIEGLFSHFACADELDKASARQQLQDFLDFANLLELQGISVLYKHIANSAAIMELSESYLSMVRSGIGTYGYYPSNEVKKEFLELTPSMEWKTNISFLKKLDAGHGIGYGSTFITDHEMVIATIPVGYADGYPRILSNKGKVLVNGKFAPIVGRICMDQFMIDITNIPDAVVGNEVTLFGRDHGSCLPVEEVALWANSFNYEFVCNVGKRVPRLYYKNGEPFLIRTYYG